MLPTINVFSEDSVYKTTDFTFYRDAAAELSATSWPSDLESQLHLWAKAELETKAKSSYEFQVSLSHLNNGKQNSGRVLACKCFAGQRWSFTVRADSTPTSGLDYSCVSPLPESKAFTPSSSYEYGVFSINDICEALRSLVFQNEREHGIVIITGSTNSSKSLVTRGMIYQQLKRRVTQLGSTSASPNPRKPHLITFEDPIEKKFWEVPPKDDQEAKARESIDYTPRQYPIDATSLSEVIHDSLRQTPEILFVGETRKNEDWKELLECAGMGYLVFTTAHAGSLPEAMGKILKATEADTPAKRSYIMDRILALVHLRSETIEIGEEKFTALMPTLWRRYGNGPHALTSDGLSAIVPNNPTNYQNQYSSLGRLWFVHNLHKGYSDTDVLVRPLEIRLNDRFDLASDKEKTRIKTIIFSRELLFKRLRKKALSLDLEGK